MHKVRTTRDLDPTPFTHTHHSIVAQNRACMYRQDSHTCPKLKMESQCCCSQHAQHKRLLLCGNACVWGGERGNIPVVIIILCDLIKEHLHVHVLDMKHRGYPSLSTCFLTYCIYSTLSDRPGMYLVLTIVIITTIVPTCLLALFCIVLLHAFISYPRDRPESTPITLWHNLPYHEILH